jgi:hypothetical protein
MNDTDIEAKPEAFEGERQADPTPAQERRSDEFPIPFGQWSRALVHTADEVWIKHMQIEHGRENHTPTEWVSLLDSYRKHPAHPGP